MNCQIFDMRKQRYCAFYQTEPFVLIRLVSKEADIQGN